MGEIGPKNDKNRLKWAFLPHGMSICALVVLVLNQHCNLSEYITQKST